MEVTKPEFEMSDDKTDMSNIITEKEKLLLRESNRQQECERKRQEKFNTSAESEQSSYFKKAFQEKRSEIEHSLKLLEEGGFDKLQLPTELDRMNKEITSLQRYIAASTLFLKQYDVRRAQEVMDALQQTFQKLESDLLPKKKFGFKTRKTTNTVSTKNDPSDSTDSKEKQPIIIPTEVYNYTDSNFGFSNKKNETLVLDSDTISKKDVSLTNLEDCTIRLLGACSSLSLISLTRCRVLAGPVATSVFVEDCTSCAIVVACQQLRVHDTKKSQLYIHVTSRAIIEDTTQVTFAPYNFKYPCIEDHFLEAGLDRNTNHWDSVDDFNWLAVDKPSPNWSILNESERITDWTLYNDK